MEEIKKLEFMDNERAVLTSSLWLISNSVRRMKDQLKPHETHTIIASALLALRDDPVDNEKEAAFMLSQLLLGLKLIEALRCDGPKKKGKRKV